MEEKRFGPHLEIILEQMCSIVDTKFDDIDWDNPEWYMTRSWDEPTQNIFEKWLVEYLKRNKDARVEILTESLHGSVSKGHKLTLLKQAVTWFLFNYGWRYKSKDELGAEKE